MYSLLLSYIVVAFLKNSVLNKTVLKRRKKEKGKEGGRREGLARIGKLCGMRENSLWRTHLQNCSSFSTAASPINAGETIQSIIVITKKQVPIGFQSICSRHALNVSLIALETLGT